MVCCLRTFLYQEPCLYIFFGSNVTCCFWKTEIPFAAFNSFLFILVTGQEEAFNTRLGIQQVEKYSAHFFIIKDVVLVLVNVIKFPLKNKSKGKDCLKQRAGRKISIYYSLFRLQDDRESARRHPKSALSPRLGEFSVTFFLPTG